MGRDRAVALLLLAFSLGYGWQARGIPVMPFQTEGFITSRTLPYLLAAAGALISFLMLVLPSRNGDDGKTIPLSVFWRGLDWKSAGLIMLAVCAYGAMIRPAGFLISTFAFLCACSFILGERRPLMLCAVHIPATLGFWLVMTQLLGQTL